MTLKQIIFLIVILFLGFINFEGIVQLLFYGPEKTYTIGLLYDSKKSQSKTNISLYQSFLIEFLHRSENKLEFLQLLNFEQYKMNVQELFMKVLPITQIMMLPWKLNYSNIQSLVISVDYSLINSKFKTMVSLYQFDQTQQIGFSPYYSLDIDGKPIKVLKNNDSVHIQIISKDSLELISIIPNLIFKQNSIISRHKFSSSIQILCWDQTQDYLAYIQNDDPTVIHIIDSSEKEEYNTTIYIDSISFQGQIVFHPLQISILNNGDSIKLVVILLTLKKSSIALRYIQFNRMTNGWKQYKNGTLSHDIGINPKQFEKVCHSIQPVHYYQPNLDIYIFSLRKLYFIELRNILDKHYSIELPSSEISKIVSFDDQYRLIIQYSVSPNVQNSILIIILMNSDFTQKLRQQIGIFQDCYDITYQKRNDEDYLFVGSQLEYLDVYYLMQHDNPSILKTSAKKLLATYALYKYSGLKIFQNYLNIF